MTKVVQFKRDPKTGSLATAKNFALKFKGNAVAEAKKCRDKYEPETVEHEYWGYVISALVEKKV